jgi:hypothetical protein
MPCPATPISFGQTSIYKLPEYLSTRETPRLDVPLSRSAELACHPAIIAVSPFAPHEETALALGHSSAMNRSMTFEARDSFLL